MRACGAVAAPSQEAPTERGVRAERPFPVLSGRESRPLADLCGDMLVSGCAKGIRLSLIPIRHCIRFHLIGDAKHRDSPAWTLPKNRTGEYRNVCCESHRAIPGGFRCFYSLSNSASTPTAKPASGKSGFSPIRLHCSRTIKLSGPATSSNSSHGNDSNRLIGFLRPVLGTPFDGFPQLLFGGLLLPLALLVKLLPAVPRGPHRCTAENRL